MLDFEFAILKFGDEAGLRSNQQDAMRSFGHECDASLGKSKTMSSARTQNESFRAIQRLSASPKPVGFYKPARRINQPVINKASITVNPATQENTVRVGHLQFRSHNFVAAILRSE